VKYYRKKKLIYMKKLVQARKKIKKQRSKLYISTQFKCVLMKW